MSLTVNPTQWSNNTKKNYATAGTIVAGIAGYNALSKVTKGKSYQWNNTINKSLRTFVKSSKEFFGSGALKNIAGKLSKTSAREKILTAFVLGAIGAGVAIREHFVKKQGAEAKQAEFNENIKNYDSLINLQSRKIDGIRIIKLCV